MKKLLITGFEPFGGEVINPSWQAVECLPLTINGYSLTKLRLPVVFGKAAQSVIAAADSLRPDAILAIGQAGGRATVMPELVGINLRHANIPDNSGSSPKDEPVIEGEAAAYFSTLPVRKIAAAISEKGIPAGVSYSAGAYVCNDVFFSLLAHFKDTKTRVGFIHIPYSTEQNKEPCMAHADIVTAIITAVENLDE